MPENTKQMTLVVGSISDEATTHIRRLGGMVYEMSATPCLIAVMLPVGSVVYKDGMVPLGRPLLVVVPEAEAGDSQWLLWTPEVSADESRLAMWRDR